VTDTSSSDNERCCRVSRTQSTMLNSYLGAFASQVE
jgi:hypothetical protein